MEQQTGRTEVSFQHITPEIIEDMRSIVERSFARDLSYALTSGSIVYGGAIKGKSDMDLMVVLKREFTEKPKSDRDRQIKGFINGYLELHSHNDFMPDLVFPGEYITEDQVDDAIAGRGYHIDQYDQLYLPKASEEYYLKDSERWYRAWLSMLAYSEYVAGNQELFEHNKVRAWDTVILFNSYNLGSPVTPKGIIDILSAPTSKWMGSGVSDRYVTFLEHELRYVENSLKNLSSKGYFLVDDGLFTPNAERINQWHTEKSIQIRQQTIRRADFIVDLNDARKFTEYAEDRWETI